MSAFFVPVYLSTAVKSVSGIVFFVFVFRTFLNQTFISLNFALRLAWKRLATVGRFIDWYINCIHGTILSTEFPQLNIMLSKAGITYTLALVNSWSNKFTDVSFYSLNLALFYYATLTLDQPLGFLLSARNFFFIIPNFLGIIYTQAIRSTAYTVCRYPVSGKFRAPEKLSHSTHLTFRNNILTCFFRFNIHTYIVWYHLLQ